jgi:hypothetical protein
MAAHTPWGPRPGESHKQYMDRLNDERLARLAAERGDPPAALPPPLSPPESPPAIHYAAGDSACDVSGESVHAWQKVGRALGNVAGSVLGKIQWQRGRIYNPKILTVNIKPPKRRISAPANWVRDVIDAFERARIVSHDVSVPYFEKIAREVWKLADDGRGYFQRAYKSIGRLAKLGRRGMEGHWGRETVRKAMDWMRENGWLGPLNSLYRDPETRELRRDSNVYQLFTKEDAAEISAIEDPSARALKRESLTLSRGAILWGLAVRPWGLNATPSPSNRHQTRTNPAPA